MTPGLEDPTLVALWSIEWRSAENDIPAVVELQRAISLRHGNT
jgi:hypothetical protein